MSSSITVGVYLGKKDRLVRYWYEILPKGQFPMLVKYCIQSYLRSNFFPLQSICDARSLKEQIHRRGEFVPTQRNVTFTPDDGPIYHWIRNLESGYRSEEIKNILKETVVHTLLNDQTTYPPTAVGQASYSAAGLEMHDGVHASSHFPPSSFYTGYEADAGKMKMMKTMDEQHYSAWDPTARSVAPGMMPGHSHLDKSTANYPKG